MTYEEVTGRPSVGHVSNVTSRARAKAVTLAAMTYEEVTGRPSVGHVSNVTSRARAKAVTLVAMTYIHPVAVGFS